MIFIYKLMTAILLMVSMVFPAPKTNKEPDSITREFPHNDHNSRASRDSSTPRSTTTRAVLSTAYCTGKTTANGESVHEGGVALNFAKMNTYWRVVETGKTYKANDHIGHGSEFDIYMSDCSRAVRYGKQYIHIVQVKN
jgi:hypothetical protein